MDLQIRFIVFLIDSKYEQHDGYIFSSIAEARKYGEDSLLENYCTGVIIADFIFDKEHKEMQLHEVDKFSAKEVKRKRKMPELFRQDSYKF